MDKEYIDSLIDDILDGNNLDAQSKFGDLIATKVSTALDQRKVDLAQTIYQDEEQEEETEE